MAEKRIHVDLKFEETGEAGELPRSFRLVKVTEHQSKYRGTWYRDTEVPGNPVREVVHELPRSGVAKLIADGADVLCWDGKEQ